MSSAAVAKETVKYMEITVKDLWKVLKKSFVFVLLGAVLLSLAFYVYTSTQVQKVYQSSAKYFLSPKHAVTDTTELNNNLVVGSRYIETLGSYLMTEETMKLLLSDVERYEKVQPGEFKLEYKYTPAKLLNLFTFVTHDKEETNLVFEVKCQAYSANDSRVLLDVFGRIVNERCQEAVLKGAYEVQTIAAPKDGVQVAPNARTNALLGAVIGAAVPYAVVLVLTVLDTRIKTEEDVKNRFDHPILGQIPRL